MDGGEPAMGADTERVLISADSIQQRVRELAKQISADYVGREITMVCVLRGAMVFAADLLRLLEIPTCVDFIAISSYGEETRSSGVVRITKDLDDSIEGRAVLVVEDIVDTGLTLRYLLENLATRNPESLRVCALLDKPARRIVEVSADYVGFTIPDEFVVGYGLDFAQRFRGLPHVAALQENDPGAQARQ
jgi:hypoxanthine phosphoribosyltransferase